MTPVLSSPEIELMLLGSRTVATAAETERMRQLAEAGLDWEKLAAFVDRHQTASLVNLHLQRLGPGVPEGIAERFRAFGRRLAVTNLGQAQELARVAHLFAREGIEAMPFKGLMLGTLVYGDLSLRRFGDLDIIVHRYDLERARDVLAANGYDPYRVMTRRKERAFYRTGMGFELVRHDGRAVVELHWTFLNRAHAFRLDPEEVWARARRVDLWGATLRTLAPEDLLIYLCAHGSKSFWERLVWVCDVAELIRREPVDWDRLLARARAVHAERMLFLGLALAQRLLGTALPPAVAARIEAEEPVEPLVAWVQGHLFREKPRLFTDAEKLRFHLDMRERVIDRVPYYGHLLWIMPQPNARDRAFVQLPPYLSFLYPVVKPLRWVHDRRRKGEDARLGEAA